jgi:hypothetical protein
MLILVAFLLEKEKGQPLQEKLAFPHSSVLISENVEHRSICRLVSLPLSVCVCVDVYVNLLFSYNYNIYYIYRLDRESEREGWEHEG